jgi:uncharacterized YigZ family protein
MLYVQQIYSSEYEIKKSLFISIIAQYKDFDSILNQLKSDHKKANHIIWAYRYFNKIQQTVENSTDDGEPKNTAGKPTLNVMRGKNLINTVIFTVRYFGGIKLGTGGLVKAYTESANKVLNIATLIPFTEEITEQITLNYSDIKKTEYLIEKNKLNVANKNFGEKNVKFIIKGDKNHLENFFKMFNN